MKRRSLSFCLPVRIRVLAWALSVLQAAVTPSVFPQEAAGPYLGMKPPGMEPEIFAPGIISTPQAWEAAITFSPDGTELMFTRRADIQGTDNRLFYMKQDGERWTTPGPAPFARNISEYEAFITPDGKRVFYNSDRPKPAGSSGIGEIWYSEKTDAGWSDGTYLTETINRGWVMFVTASADNTLYFTAGFNRRFGIWASDCVDGVYQEPRFLPEEINYLRGAHPFIAPDASYLVFDAQPEGMGKSQLFVSFRDGQGGWTRAVPLDAAVNATFTENIPHVSPDGTYFFFHRNNDIYWVDAEVIHRLNPFTSR
ncbi:PD40 domain-containing protein [bacterium]|nr:PD40 domain-containing protein [bacterium]